MASKKSTLLFVAVLFSCVARADFINANTQSIDTSTAVGRHVDFDTTLNIDQFDPALGTLNSINFRFNFAGKLFWQVLSQTEGRSFIDLGVRGNASLLGVNALVNGGTVFGHIYYSACGGSAPLPGSPWFSTYLATCPDAYSLYAGSCCGFQFDGVIANGASTFHADGLQSKSGALLTLDKFIGASQLTLPVSLSLDGFVNDMPSIQVGDFAADQQGSAALYLTYNYTPAPISHTPEPRLAGLLAGLCGLLLYRLRRSVHQGESLRAS